jgi:hypothetical protein
MPGSSYRLAYLQVATIWKKGLLLDEGVRKLFMVS